MKKRSCAALLSLFMVLTMLPVTAFAAEPDVPEIAVATLHDTSNSLADNELYTAYKIVEKGQPDEDGIIPVHISVDGLKKHANAQNNMGYWAGLAVACPEGAGNPSNIEYRMSTWADDESISTTPLEANVIGDKPGIAFYYNLDEFPHAQKQYAYVKFADGYEYLFEITFTATLTGEKSEDHGTLKNTYGGTVNPEDANEIVFDGNDKLYFSEDKQCWVAKVPITPPAKTFDKNTFAVHFEGDGGAKPWNEMVTFDEATGDLIIQSPLYQPMDFYEDI